jgi:hypothetical protein
MCCEGGMSGLLSNVHIEVGARVEFIVSVAAPILITILQYELYVD